VSPIAFPLGQITFCFSFFPCPCCYRAPASRPHTSAAARSLVGRQCTPVPPSRVSIVGAAHCQPAGHWLKPLRHGRPLPRACLAPVASWSGSSGATAGPMHPPVVSSQARDCQTWGDGLAYRRRMFWNKEYRMGYVLPYCNYLYRSKTSQLKETIR